MTQLSGSRKLAVWLKASRSMVSGIVARATSGEPGRSRLFRRPYRKTRTVASASTSGYTRTTVSLSATRGRLLAASWMAWVTSISKPPDPISSTRPAGGSGSNLEGARVMAPNSEKSEGKPAGTSSSKAGVDEIARTPRLTVSPGSAPMEARSMPISQIRCWLQTILGTKPMSVKRKLPSPMKQPNPAP